MFYSYYYHFVILMFYHQSIEGQDFYSKVVYSILFYSYIVFQITDLWIFCLYPNVLYL